MNSAQPPSRPAARFRRPARFPRTVKGRARLRTFLILVAALGAGYLVTCLAYPAPLVSPDVAVGRVLGLPLEAAREELVQQGFRVRIENPVSDPVIPSGHVVWQDPPPRTQLPRGSAVVSITPSSGPAAVAVPDVAGFDFELARQVVTAAGFRIGTIDSIASSTEPGVVISTRPEPGNFRAPGAPLDLVVSRGVADTRVPNLVGARREEVRDRLESVGLKLGSISTRATDRNPPGLVVEQRPSAGMLRPRGARVNIVVSQ